MLKFGVENIYFFCFYIFKIFKTVYEHIFGETFAAPLHLLFRTHKEFISTALGLKINIPVNEKWTNLRLDQTISVKLNTGKKYGRCGDTGKNRM